MKTYGFGFVMLGFILVAEALFGLLLSSRVSALRAQDAELQAEYETGVAKYQKDYAAHAASWKAYGRSSKFMKVWADHAQFPVGNVVSDRLLELAREVSEGSPVSLYCEVQRSTELPAYMFGRHKLRARSYAIQCTGSYGQTSRWLGRVEAEALLWRVESVVFKMSAKRVVAVVTLHIPEVKLTPDAALTAKEEL
ncbi:hypothetical protein OH491_23990 [Termitidicoccus mucosus]|uniref:Uncharacterized protein n=1 Tax=Termitidicoccus mucosus TaxID=1184151 RepID=A0A178INS8_9BACT|nr:hypothetical protein AW736_02510 [Opitutaceae bacterium TSB47]